MTEHPTVGEPTPSNDRGFLAYAGGPIETSYGHTIRVQESSAASGPHVWLFIEQPGQTEQARPPMLLAGGQLHQLPPLPPKQPAPHLNLEQAIALRAALDQFIDGVPERWTDGQAMLDEAKRVVLGDGHKES